MAAGYDPNASIISGGAFPGSSSDPGVQAQDAQLGLSAKLAAIPVVLKGATRQVLAMHGEPLNPSDITRIVRLDEAMNSLNGMTSDEVESLQNQLYASGFYASSYYGKKPPSIVKGMVDAATTKAWENALLQSAKDQEAIQTTLATRAAQRQGAGMPVAFTDTSNAVTLSNPDDLRAAIRNAGPGVIGRRPDAAIEENFISAFHNAEANAGKPDANGNVVAGPSDARALAEQYLQTAYPQEAYDNGYLGAFDTFRKMIGGANG